jgi:hypothetical protein
MSADGRVGLWPQDLHPRADAVMTFTVGHMAVQDELDARPDRDLAEWIALMSGDVGRAAMLIARDPEEPDALRAAVARLARAPTACAPTARSPAGAQAPTTRRS